MDGPFWLFSFQKQKSLENLLINLFTILFMSFKTNQIGTIRILLCAINDLCKPPAFFNFMLSRICYWNIDMKTPYEMASLSTIEGAGCEATFFSNQMCCKIVLYAYRVCFRGKMIFPFTI